VTALVLDAEALSRLARPGLDRAAIRAAMDAANRLYRTVYVPAVILAELYRCTGHNSIVDACLARETGIQVRDTDRGLARLVGGVLAAARAGSEDLADAHVVATAIDAGGGVVLTGDPGDLERLAAGHPRLVVQAI
jgi:predicted nucleic acid-binding protein